MKANRRMIAQLGRDDSAVSPVIAVILMVAITVVLAATVYVWVSGFSDTSDQAPSASFKVMNCDTSNEEVIVKLLSGGPLQEDDVKVIAFDTDGVKEGTISTLGSSTWSVGDALDIGDSTNYAWDSGDAATLDDDTEYTIDFVHKPSQQIIASVNFVC